MDIREVIDRFEQKRDKTEKHNRKQKTSAQEGELIIVCEIGWRKWR